MKILITGHTGFKGSWLSLILKSQGHEVFGISLPPENNGIFLNANVSKILSSNIFLDIRDKEKLNKLLSEINPDFIFHLAAQPLVRKSFDDLYETYSTNVSGTLNILDAALYTTNLRGMIVVTTDKVYKNNENQKPFIESDELGGKDPYSASKAIADILTQDWQNQQQEFSLGIARAGNVIGGGDVAKNRLLPDIFRSIESSTILKVRNPNSVRPWQHVLDCLNGYLLFMTHVIEGNSEIFNFGPESESVNRVDEVVRKTLNYFDLQEWKIELSDVKEAKFLTLDSSKAKKILKWENKLSLDEAILTTVEWQKKSMEKKNLFEYSNLQISNFFQL